MKAHIGLRVHICTGCDFMARLIFSASLWKGVIMTYENLKNIKECYTTVDRWVVDFIQPFTYQNNKS